MANANQLKTDLEAQAEALSIDVDALGEDGKPATNAAMAAAINEKEAAIAAAREAAEAELPVNADTLVAMDPSLAVPLAGLLAAEPHLAEAEQELTHAEWAAELEKYLQSARP